MDQRNQFLRRAAATLDSTAGADAYSHLNTWETIMAVAVRDGIKEGLAAVADDWPEAYTTPSPTEILCRVEAEFRRIEGDELAGLNDALKEQGSGIYGTLKDYVYDTCKLEAENITYNLIVDSIP
jgi:hypothetical protein